MSLRFVPSWTPCYSPPASSAPDNPDNSSYDPSLSLRAGLVLPLDLARSESLPLVNDHDLPRFCKIHRTVHSRRIVLPIPNSLKSDNANFATKECLSNTIANARRCSDEPGTAVIRLLTYPRFDHMYILHHSRSRLPAAERKVPSAGEVQHAAYGKVDAYEVKGPLEDMARIHNNTRRQGMYLLFVLFHHYAPRVLNQPHHASTSTTEDVLCLCFCFSFR